MTKSSLLLLALVFSVCTFAKEEFKPIDLDELARLVGGADALCFCPKADRDKIKNHNKEFIAQQTKRLTDDVEEFRGLHGKREGELKKKYALFVDSKKLVEEDWQLKSIKLFIDQKREALKRLERYQAKFDKLPNLKLHVRDLYHDLNPEDCKKEGPVDRNMLRQIEEGRRITKFFRKEDDDEEKIFIKAMQSNLLWREQWQEDHCSFKKGEGSETEASSSDIDKEDCEKCKELARIESQIRDIKAGLKKDKCKGVVSCVGSPTEFLEELQANRTIVNPVKTGPFSSLYSKPDNQGYVVPDNASEEKKEEMRNKATSACVGFAVKNDIEGILSKRSLEGTPMPAPDPWEIYLTMQGQSDGKGCNGFVQGKDYKKGTNEIKGLNILSEKPICMPGIRAKVKVEKALALYDTEKINFDFFKKLIDHDQHPMVILESEWNEDREQWVQPVRGGRPHIAQIVNYGEAIHPVTLKKEPYVVMRDSIYTQPVHQWMSVDDLKKILLGVVKINKIKVIEDDDGDKK